MSLLSKQQKLAANVPWRSRRFGLGHAALTGLLLVGAIAGRKSEASDQPNTNPIHALVEPTKTEKPKELNPKFKNVEEALAFVKQRLKSEYCSPDSCDIYKPSQSDITLAFNLLEPEIRETIQDLLSNEPTYSSTPVLHENVIYSGHAADLMNDDVYYTLYVASLITKYGEATVIRAYALAIHYPLPSIAEVVDAITNPTLGEGLLIKTGELGLLDYTINDDDSLTLEERMQLVKKYGVRRIKEAIDYAKQVNEGYPQTSIFEFGDFEVSDIPFYCNIKSINAVCEAFA